jgi:hypothetical protein
MQTINWLTHEVSAMQQRLAKVPTFASTIPMVHDAVPNRNAIAQADSIVQASRHRLSGQLEELQQQLIVPAAQREPLQTLHRRYLVAKLRFNALLYAVDIFADALTQRAEHGVGVLLRGLDRFAEDSLRTKGDLMEIPPLVCYLAKGLGGAIRRAFTALPSGETNLVAMVQVPRERLCGAGLASLVHEAAHQGSALLNVTPSYALALRTAGRKGQIAPEAAEWWSKKANETISDLWAVCKLGPTGTIGLSSVMGLIPAFVFNDRPEDPHPMAWFRVLLSATFGAKVLPHPIWAELAKIWQDLYPAASAPLASRARMKLLLESLPGVVDVYANHRPSGFRGLTMSEALETARLHPNRLLPPDKDVRTAINTLRKQNRPCELVAAVSLARFRQHISAQEEDGIIRSMLLDGIAA